MTAPAPAEDTNNLQYVLDREWYVRSLEGSRTDETERALVGQTIFSIISDSTLRELLRVIFQKVYERNKFVYLNYRCDTPELRRFCTMRVERRRTDEGMRIVVENRTILAQPRVAMRVLDGRQIRSEERLAMCSWCKKIQWTEEEWVEVEVAMERGGLMKCVRLPTLTHGMCPACVTYLSQAATDLETSRD